MSDSLHAIFAAWLNASQRSHVDVVMNKSAGGDVQWVNTLDTALYKTMTLYLFLSFLLFRLILFFTVLQGKEIEQLLDPSKVGVGSGLYQGSHRNLIIKFHDFSMTICTVFHDARKANTEVHLPVFI